MTNIHYPEKEEGKKTIEVQTKNKNKKTHTQQ
jgi:hypothetical protein